MVVTFRSLGQFGRLGNQLFQIAATIGIARANGMEYAFPAWSYADYFAESLPKMPLDAEYLPTVRETTFHYTPVTLSGSADLVGYFQSEKYFKVCEAEIRQVFRFRDWVERKSLERFGHELEGVCCSLHVRRGDYVTNTHFTDLSATDYYERALETLTGYDRVLVFSDDIVFCRQRFQGDQFHFVETGHPIADLFLMSRCQMHIIANSSFSWWGAWLNPDPSKRIIAPQNWFAGPAADPTLPFRQGPPHGGYHDVRDLISFAIRILVAESFQQGCDLLYAPGDLKN